VTSAYVLMTALPPTKGHMRLVEYAAHLADDVQVIVCTQPDEPGPYERYYAVADRFSDAHNVFVHHHHEQIEQNPEAVGFKEMWRGIMRRYGCTAGEDLIVASEPYGAWVAEITGTTFMPYDPGRELTPVKATNVREDPWNNFHLIAEEFQGYLRINVTVFGAESTGKTTLARDLAELYDGHYFFEYARPYLESVGPDITVESMRAIWAGQLALELHAGENFHDKPIAFFDTDLFSTVGYWAMSHWVDALGPVPDGLIDDATSGKADLYIITRSNIPFEEDPLRYGGDHREASDDYWIAVAEQYGLNYVVLDSEDRHGRWKESVAAIEPLWNRMRDNLTYDRGGF
jgi:HTH-type transcriptional repressor of NAD biosynthesis genes